jgi:hypothetical protein
MEPEPGTFAGALSELIRLTGAEPPAVDRADRAWEARARRALREVFRRTAAAPEWFEPLLRAAVTDPDPSHCRVFVEPAIVAYGPARVQEALIRVLRDGTDRERAGAARAWYWAWLPLRPGVGSNYSVGPAGPVEDDTAAARERARRWAILGVRIFVATGDLGLRRSLLPHLPLHVDRYPPDVQELVREAIRIARTSGDSYLRHRVEAQL